MDIEIHCRTFLLISFMQLAVQNRASNYLLYSFHLFVLHLCPPVKKQEQQTELLKIFSLGTVTFIQHYTSFHACTHPEPAFGYKQTNTIFMCNLSIKKVVRMSMFHHHSHLVDVSWITVVMNIHPHILQ